MNEMNILKATDASKTISNNLEATHKLLTPIRIHVLNVVICLRSAPVFLF